MELSNPGSILPGVVGGICLILAFYALGTLPVNYAGLGLILFGFLLFLADIFAASHGILTTGGVIAFVLGSLLLFNVPEAGPFLNLSLSVIAGVSIALAAFFAFIVGALVRARRWKVKTGREGLVGQVGYARTALDPDGMILLDGELWQATSEDGAVQPGEPVEVLRLERLRVFVRPQPTAETASPEARASRLS
jgi:membrane-bound serine protease (ClpP class)